MIQFLSIGQIIAINKQFALLHNGIFGVRDINLLESATLEPQAGFGNEYLYKNIYEMAAAYIYNIIKNHPFLDGNKRTGVAAAILFLYNNGHALKVSRSELTKLAIDLASSQISKQDAAKKIALYCSSKKR